MTNDENITCKLCQSANTIKFGIQAGTQMYYCKDCQRKFKNDDSLPGHRVSSGNISSALLEYYSGMSINDIRRLSKQETGFEPAQSTIYQWIDKFTDKAVKYYAQFKPNVGDTWIADETVIHLHGANVWFWDIIDADTRFLLASKMSFTRTTEDAKTLFELAKSRAGKSPKSILTDKLDAYPEAMRQVFGADADHIQSNPFEHQDSTRAIERWHETIRERTKVIYSLKDTNSALGFLDGFMAYYNFIRPHEGMNDKTPAEVAGIKYDVKDWVSLIHLTEPKITPEYTMSEDLLLAREQVSGKPYPVGRGHKNPNSIRNINKRKHEQKLLQQAILAKPKRGRPPKKLTIREKHIVSNRKTGYAKATNTIKMLGRK